MEGKEMKKTLYKSRKDRFLFGVCGGLAEYFDRLGHPKACGRWACHWIFRGPGDVYLR